MVKYIIYTETSQEFDPKAVNEKTGKIGEHKNASYYLLYSPDGKRDRALDLPTLKAIAKAEKNKHLVIYCEKIWFNRDDYLTLLQFFLNHRRFLRSEHSERSGKSPAELLSGHRHPHWLELLGHRRFSRN